MSSTRCVLNAVLCFLTDVVCEVGIRVSILQVGKLMRSGV